MMTQKQLVPKRRFEGFSDEWKVNSFNDLLDELEGIRRGPFGSALKKEYFVPHSNYVVYEQQNAIYDRYQTRYYITKQKYEELSRFSINEDDFIMSGAGTIGRISKVPKDIKKGVINQALIRIRVNKKIVDSNYFLQWMRSEDMQNKLTQANPASAMVNLVPMSEVKGWQIKVPSIEEQQEIGQFFKHLDEMIAQQQRKIDKTKALKSAYLVEMFPAEGEHVPKRRFAGFIDEWQIRKIEEVAPLRNGKGFESNNFKNNGVPIIRISNILSTGNIGGNYIYYDEEDNDADYTIPNGAALIAMSGATTGKISVMKITNYEKVYQNQRVGMFKDLGKANYNYLITLLQSELFESQLMSVLVAGAQPNISSQEINNFEFFFPDNINEQEMVGNFFKNIDNLIATHQQKLDKLKATKQAYLHEMFV